VGFLGINNVSLITTLKSFLAAPKAIDKALDVGEKITSGIISGLDKLVFTDEERADIKQKSNELLLEFWGKIANENTEQSKARRSLAMMTFKVYFFLLLAGVVVYKIDTAYSQFIFDVAGTLTWLVSGIAAIFFGPHQLSKVIKKK